MIQNVYELSSDTERFSSFIERYSAHEESIMGRAMARRWQRFDSQYAPITLELSRSDSGRRSYDFDLSAALCPFLIFSESALDALNSTLPASGQVLEVLTESKRRRFYGYYPTNALRDCFDKHRSRFQTARNGLVVDTPVLLRDRLRGESLFTIEEDIRRVFVTEEFKRAVESSKLLGFDFSRKVPLS
ncbi:imm11 family protein [Stenotrophomonas sp. AR026]|uniref:imm11 family protein n=1 Tax=Stenotrophomonas sp. AR026 TaxID=3398462 RepID=UPI00130F8C1E